MPPFIPHTVTEGEKGGNGTQNSAETDMDGEKWKRWRGDGEDCQSVKLRGSKREESQRRCEDGKSGF